MHITREKQLPIGSIVDIYTEKLKYMGRGQIMDAHLDIDEKYMSNDENNPEYETVIEEIHFFIYTVKYHRILNTGKPSRSWSNINCRRNRIRIVSIEDGAIIRK